MITAIVQCSAMMVVITSVFPCHVSRWSRITRGKPRRAQPGADFPSRQRLERLFRWLFPAFALLPGPDPRFCRRRNVSYREIKHLLAWWPLYALRHKLRATFAEEGIPPEFLSHYEPDGPFAGLRQNDGLSDKF